MVGSVPIATTASCSHGRRADDCQRPTHPSTSLHTRPVRHNSIPIVKPPLRRPAGRRRWPVVGGAGGAAAGSGCAAGQNAPRRPPSQRASLPAPAPEYAAPSSANSEWPSTSLASRGGRIAGRSASGMVAASSRPRSAGAGAAMGCRLRPSDRHGSGDGGARRLRGDRDRCQPGHRQGLRAGAGRRRRDGVRHRAYAKGRRRAAARQPGGNPSGKSRRWAGGRSASPATTATTPRWRRSSSAWPATAGASTCW